MSPHLRWSVVLLALFAVACTRTTGEDGPSLAATTLTSTPQAPPTIGGEQELDPPVIGPAYLDQQEVAAAFGAGKILAVWKDSRGGGTSDLWGQLFGTGGIIDDSFVGEPMHLPMLGNDAAPTVAYDGTRFLVVWHNDFSGSGDLFGVFVEFDGTISPVLHLISNTSTQDQPALAADPGTATFFLAWRDRREGGDRIYATRINALTGQTLDGPAGQGVRLSLGTATANSPAVAFNGGEFVAVWSDLRASPAQIYGNRMDASGGILDGTGVRIDPTGFAQTNPSVAGSGGQALAVWQESRDGTGADLFGRLLLGMTSQAPSPLQVTALSGVQGDPAVVFDSVNYWVTYESEAPGEDTEVHVTRLSTAGVVNVSGTQPNADGGVFNPAIVARSNSSVTVLYDEGTSTQRGDVHVAPVSVPFGNTFQWAPATLLSRGANVQFDPDVATNGEVGLAVFFDTRLDEAKQIFGTWIELDGTPRGPAFPLVVNDAEKDLPKVIAGDDGAFLVTWADDARISGRKDLLGIRLRPDGGLVDPSTRLLSDAGSNAVFSEHTAVFSADSYLVVYPTLSERLYMRRMFTDGGSPDDSRGILIQPSGGRSPELATDGTQRLLVYRRGSPIDNTIHAARIDPDGVVHEPDGLELSPGDASYQFPQAAFDGVTYRVSWKAYEGSEELNYLTDFGPDGVAGTPAVFQDTPNAENALALTFDGDRVLAAFTRELEDGGTDLIASWIDPSGAVVAPGTRVAAVKPRFAFPPAASGGTDGRALLVYQRTTLDGVRNSDRLYVTSVDSRGELGTSCDAAGDCRSGFCSDGVCCNTSCGGGNDGDCRACGASGICEVLSSGVTCREAAGACDEAETCDGASTQCPIDEKVPAGTVCRDATAPCDLDEVCDGSSELCPADVVAPATVECRPASGGCDLPELCDGQNLNCPQDVLAPADTACRSAVSSCDVTDVCTGASKECPTDTLAADGVACEDEGVCVQGTCTAPKSFYGWDCQGCASGGGGGAPLWGGLLLLGWLYRRRRAPREAPSRGLRGTTSCAALHTFRGSPESGHWLPVGTTKGREGGLRAAEGGHWLSTEATKGRDGPATGVAPRRIGMAWPLLLLAGLAATEARAADETTKLMVLGITPRAGIAPQQAETVNSFLQTELTSFGAYRVTGSAEIAAVIGLERQKQLMGCNEEAAAECMAEIAGALDTDRIVSGDLGRLGEELVLNVSLIDARSTKLIHRVSVRTRGALEALLDEVKPALYELVTRDLTRKGPAKLTYEKGFGGIVASVRGEADVARFSATPAVSVELSSRTFGGALTVLVQPRIGLRAEGRYYPLQIGRLRPYVALGATSFIPVVGGRVAVGAAFRLAQLQLSADLAYEHFFNPAPGFFGNAALFALGAGWQF